MSAKGKITLKSTDQRTRKGRAWKGHQNGNKAKSGQATVPSTPVPGNSVILRDPNEAPSVDRESEAGVAAEDNAESTEKVSQMQKAARKVGRPRKKISNVDAAPAKKKPCLSKREKPKFGFRKAWRKKAPPQDLS